MGMNKLSYVKKKRKKNWGWAGPSSASTGAGDHWQWNRFQSFISKQRWNVLVSMSIKHDDVFKRLRSSEIEAFKNSGLQKLKFSKNEVFKNSIFQNWRLQKLKFSKVVVFKNEVFKIQSLKRLLHNSKIEVFKKLKSSKNWSLKKFKSKEKKVFKNWSHQKLKSSNSKS